MNAFMNCKQVIGAFLYRVYIDFTSESLIEESDFNYRMPLIFPWMSTRIGS